MIIQMLYCPYCQDTDIVRHGRSPEGKQRYRCRECREGRGRTFLLDDSYARQSASRRPREPNRSHVSPNQHIVRTARSHREVDYKASRPARAQSSSCSLVPPLPPIAPISSPLRIIGNAP